MTNEELLRAIFGVVRVAVEESGERRFCLPDGRIAYPLPKKKSADGAIVPDLYISPFPQE